MNTQVSPEQKIVLVAEESSAADAALPQAIAAFIFGAVILFAVGFLPMEVAHNAAHDARHALAFPCH